METLQLQRSAQRALDIKRWLNAKSVSFSLLAGETVTRMQVLFYAPVKKTVNFFGNPEIYSNFAAVINSECIHSAELGYCSAKIAGAFFCPHIIASASRLPFRKYTFARRVKSLFLTNGMCSRFSVSPRLGGTLAMVKNSAMKTLQLQRSTQRAFVIRGWLNAKSDSFSLLAGETVTRMQVLLVHLAGLFILLTAVLVNFSLLLSVVSAFAAAWMVATLNRKGGEA